MHWTRAFVVPLLLLASCGRTDPEPPAGGESPPPVTPEAVGLLADSGSARTVLARYWEHLSEGRYEEAAELYGGNWREAGATWVEPHFADTMSTAGFLRHACGGLLVCSLRLEEVRRVELKDPTRLQLTTTLEHTSGGRFLRGPCCGEEGAPQDTFTFVLRKQSGEFVVEELPIYVP
jgi:hypothetical protein